MAALQQMCRALVNGVADLVFPPHCVACGRMGAWLCADCLARMPENLPAVQRETETVLQGLYSVYPHVGAAQKAVHALKYEGVRVLAAPLGQILSQRWAAVGERVDWVTAVPLHRTRARRRGYNQSELLARQVSTQLSIPMAAGMLVRGRDTRSQVGLGHQERWDNVWDAFECQDNRVRDSRVLVIDDVYTTGATLEACGWTLLDAGAASVSALTLTYAVRGDGVDLKRRV